MLSRRLLLVGLLALLGATGAVAGSVKEASDGAPLYFGSVNARGGIGGQQLDLVSLDDPFDPELAVESARTLIGQGVIAPFLTRCDLGGLALSCNATDHTGPDCADLSIIGADGRLRR